MIHRERLETDVVSTCNLSCTSCGHVAPYYKRNDYSFEEYSADLKELAKVFHVRDFVIMGGEPTLLGNKLEKYIVTARESGIGDVYRLVTNGILLHRIDLDILRQFDQIWISLYEVPEKQKIIEWHHENKHLFKELSLMPRTHFSNCFSAERLTEDRARESYKHCGASGGKGCNLLYRGHVYLCAPAGKFGKALQDRGITLSGKQGVEIHSPNLEERLQAYFASSDLLPSCYHCLGYIGDHPWSEE